MWSLCQADRFRKQKRIYSAAVTYASDAANFVYNRETGIVSILSDDGKRPPEPTFQSIIGLEIHAQLAIPTKLFSSAPTKHHPVLTADRGSAPRANELVAPHDMGYPGTLPRISSAAVRAAVLSACALQCEVHRTSRFERKHYAYADLPLGYQVTQQRWPIGTNGVLQCRRWGNVGGKKAKNKKKKKSRRGGEYTSADAVESAQAVRQVEEPMDKFFSVGVDRVQIEQDTGKTTTISEYEGHGSQGRRVTRSLVDLNRAGCALIEIVFLPDIRSAHEAASAIATLQQLLRHIGTCDGKMEQGSLRCDLNVSIAPLSGCDQSVGDNDNPFQTSLPPGTGHRVEVKNLNSIREVIEAAEHEALRQAETYRKGTPTGRETRTFDPRTGKTAKIRSKGGAVDYRFMPEPDLPPLILNEGNLGGMSLDKFLADSLPELPEEATSRLMEEYGLAEDVALVITADRPAIGLFEEAVSVASQCLNDTSISQSKDQLLERVPSAVANWLCNDLFGRLKESATRRDGKQHPDAPKREEDDSETLNHPISVEYSNVDAKRLGSLVALVLEGKVSTRMGKKILSVMFSEDLIHEPHEIAEARGWKVIIDREELRSLCRRVVHDERNKAQLEQYGQGGKHVRKITKFFVGQVMAESKGNAHPELMAEELKAVLEEYAPGVAGA